MRLRNDRSTADEATVTPPTGRLTPDQVVVIAILALGTFVMVLSEMAMGVALPQVMADLNVTAGVGQWLTTAYALTMAVVIPASGFIVQRVSLRALFIATMGVFTLGTVVAATAPIFEVLLAGRVLQALATAILIPLLTTTAIRIAPEGRRGQLMAVTTAVPSVAGAMSPAISGIVVSQLSWRWIFIIVLPLSVIALVVGAWKMRDLGHGSAARLDPLSLVLAAVGFGSLVYGLSALGEGHGESGGVTAGLAIAAGVLGIAAFVARQIKLQKTGTPMLDMRIFRSRDFTIGALLFLALIMTVFGLNIVYPLVLQNYIGLNALETGFLLIPGGFAIAITAALVGRLYDSVGPRFLVLIGAVLSTAGWMLLGMFSASAPVVVLLLLHLLISVGAAWMWTPLFTVALVSLRSNLYPHGSAALATLQQLGGAAGIAVLVAVLTVATVGTPSAGDGNAGMAATFFVACGIVALTIVGAFFLPSRTRAGIGPTNTES